MSDVDSEALLNYRAKRDSNCHHHQQKNKELPSQRCCKEAIEKPDAFEKIKDLKKECFTHVKGNRSEVDMEFEMFSCERIEKKKEDMQCAYECISKRQKIVSRIFLYFTHRQDLNFLPSFPFN